MYVDECVWFWIVKGAARMARLAQSFSTFQRFPIYFSEVDIRNMNIEDFQRAVRDVHSHGQVWKWFVCI